MSGPAVQMQHLHTSDRFGYEMEEIPLTDALLHASIYAQPSSRSVKRCWPLSAASVIRNLTRLPLVDCICAKNLYGLFHTCRLRDQRNMLEEENLGNSKHETYGNIPPIMSMRAFGTQGSRTKVPRDQGDTHNIKRTRLRFFLQHLPSRTKGPTHVSAPTISSIDASSCLSI